MKKIKDNLIEILFLCLLCLFCGGIAVENKVGYDVDEIYSYGLANHQYNEKIDFDVKPEEIYYPSIKPFANYMTVESGHEFDYINVYKNQIIDTHPPLYYCLLHTICSFFPGKFSKWFGGIVNTIVYTISSVLVYFICLEFFDRKRSLIIALAYAINPGIISMITLYRMYCLLQFWVLLAVWISLNMHSVRIVRKKMLVLVLVTLGGMLTHYYFGIALWGIYLTMCLYNIVKGEYHNTHKIIVSGVVSVLMYLTVWPFVIIHCFTKGWGKRTIAYFEGRREAVGFYNTLKLICNNITTNLCGRGLFIIIFLLVLLIVVKNYHVGGKEYFAHLIQRIFAEKDRYEKVMYFIAPIFTYALLFSIVNLRTDIERFIYPIYGMIFLLCAFLICWLLSFLLKNNTALLVIILLLITIDVYHSAQFKYLFLERKASLSLSINDSDYVFIGDGNDFGAFWTSFPEVSQFCSSEYFLEEKIEDFPNKNYLLETNVGVELSYRVSDHDYVLNKLLDQMPYANSYRLNCDYKAANSYIIEGKGITIEQYGVIKNRCGDILSYEKNTPYSLKGIVDNVECDELITICYDQVSNEASIGFGLYLLDSSVDDNILYSICYGAENQKWIIEKNMDGNRIIDSINQQALSVNEDGKLILGPVNDNDKSQLWIFEKRK